jgi:hypothetical protein
VKTILLAFLLSLGLGNAAFGADESAGLQNEKNVTPDAQDAAGRPGGGGGGGHMGGGGGGGRMGGGGGGGRMGGGGPVGHPGPVGPIGHPGGGGPIGHPGPIGPIGHPGGGGPIGHPGPVGPIGHPGPVGPRGPEGQPGPVGPRGPIGHPGHINYPRGPYHGGYDNGHWHYPDGRLYPVYPRGWGWDRSWHPAWWVPTIVFPSWIWISEIPAGYWQCTAFDAEMNPFAAVGPDVNQAAFNATYACGGQEAGCYIPPNYCQFR